MFCILISGQDKHKVSQFGGPILCPSNLISSMTAFVQIFIYFSPCVTLFSQLNL